MDEINNSSLGPNIDDTPLGGKSLGSMLGDKHIDSPSKGLEGLLNLRDNQSGQPAFASESNNTEVIEYVEQTKKELQTSLDQLAGLPYRIESLDRTLNELLAQKKSNQLKKEITQEVIQGINKQRPKTTKENFITFLALGVALISFAVHLSKEEVPSKKAPLKTEVKTPVIKKVSHPKAVTLKFVNLREKGSSKGKILTTIMPGQSLKILKTKGPWHQVSWQDLINKKTINGWVYFENIRKI